MKTSKTLRKYLSLFLCLCISAFNLPAYAYTAAVDEDVNYVKVELTDEAMSETVGAGNVDATMVDYSSIDRMNGVAAQAVLANRSILHCGYTLNLIDINGGFIETMTTGSLPPGTAALVSGTPTAGTNFSGIQVHIWNSGVPGLSSTDATIPN